MAFTFLTAQWKHLGLISYAVDPQLLRRHVPPGLELDTRDGQAFVSLVAFNFCDTRVLGIPWPGYRRFAELNLRFYVRRGSERGVVFLREYAPHRLVATVAKWFFNESYLPAPIYHEVREDEASVTGECRLLWAGRTHTIRVTGRKPAIVPAEDSTEHFFKEHHWGFGTDRHGHTVRYRVDHPVWQVYPAIDFLVDLDWRSVYGPEWEPLASQTPCSVVLAIGSPVTVHYKERLPAAPSIEATVASR